MKEFWGYPHEYISQDVIGSSMSEIMSKLLSGNNVQGHYLKDGNK